MGLFGPSAGSTSVAPGTEQAKASAGKSVAAKAGQGKPPESILPDDDVTLSAGPAGSAPKTRLALVEYKHTVAEDTAFVRETLRHKLAEYEMPPGTRLGISKNTLGQIEINAQLPEATRARIEQDLNQSQAFRSAFERLAVNQPTLDYVDNVMKLSEAYGTRNSVFDSLISQDNQFNGLQDIAHRYQSVRQTLPAEPGSSGDLQRYQFSVNA